LVSHLRWGAGMARLKSVGKVEIPHWPALDGLRGLAVAAVLLFHAGFGWARGGYLGVSAFFTLSGFLITTLLLTEWRETGRVSLQRFWSRRLRRLMPVALVALAGIVVFGAVVADPDQVRGLRADVLAALGYSANWRFIFSGQSYAAQFQASSPVLHFWSLAIEEQFYLCFPLLALLALRLRGRRGLSVTLVVLAAGSIAVGRWLLDTGASTDRLYYGTDTRAFELLFGALLAVAIAGSPSPRRRVSRLALQGGGALALLAMIVLWTTFAQSDRWLHRGGLLVHAVLTTLVVASAVQPAGPVRALLGRASLRRLGLISYGVYVYHWPLFLWLDADRTGLSRLPLFALRAGVTVALAACSYRLLERPIREGRRLTGRRPWAVAPAGAVAVCIALVVVTASPPQPTIVYSAVLDHPPRVTPQRVLSAPASSVPSSSAPAASAPASSARPVRIMVVGDSVGQTVGRGIERLAIRTGAAVVSNSALGWCAIGRGGVVHLFDTGTLNQRGCRDWSERWNIAGFHPDVVVVLSTLWEIAPREQPQWDGVRRFGDPDYDRWLWSEYLAMTAYVSSQGARVVWLTAPCAAPAPSRVRFWSNDAGELAALVRLNRMVSSLPAAVAPARLRVIDLFAHVCPRGEFTQRLGDVDNARPDGMHFSDAGADWVAEWLCPELLDHAPACSNRPPLHS
jgi:peptidoglycan/LPS O-acetylase OafA/YrhL